MTNLDVAALPRQFVWNDQINLGSVVYSLRNTFSAMTHAGILAGRENFGFAMANPNVSYIDTWNDPYKLIGLVVGWGPEAHRYMANACRKLRPTARTLIDTEELRRKCPEMFQDEVTSNPGDTEFPWGDFPFDGAVLLNVQDHFLLGAVSAFPKEQDPMVARLILGAIGLAMFESDEALTG